MEKKVSMEGDLTAIYREYDGIRSLEIIGLPEEGPLGSFTADGGHIEFNDTIIDMSPARRLTQAEKSEAERLFLELSGEEPVREEPEGIREQLELFAQLSGAAGTIPVPARKKTKKNEMEM